MLMCTHHPLVWARVVPNGFDTPLLVAEQKCYGMSLRCAGPSNCEFKDEGAAAGTWSVPGIDTVLYARDFTATNDSLHDSPVMFVVQTITIDSNNILVTPVLMARP